MVIQLAHEKSEERTREPEKPTQRKPWQEHHFNRL